LRLFRDFRTKQFTTSHACAGSAYNAHAHPAKSLPGSISVWAPIRRATFLSPRPTRL
jgi:hypothetical protein